MLRSEAIRLIFRQEQNHELNDTNHQSVAPTLSRRHADAQTFPQDPEQLTDTTVNDQQSFNLIRQGGKMHEQGMKALYDKYAAHFCKFFKYQGLNEADAKDVVQETFTKIFSKCESYRGDAPLAAWLWRIARNCMTDHFRSSKSTQAFNLDDDKWDELERVSEALYTFDWHQSSEFYEDCVVRGFAEFAKKSPKFGERAHAVTCKVVQGRVG